MKGRRRLCATVWLVVAAWVAPHFEYALGGVARADELRAEPPSKRRVPPEAVEAFSRARDFYTEGRYREAIAELERALLLDPKSPTLVYNLGRVHELLGELDPALSYYQLYLRMAPESDPERPKVANAVERVRGALAQRPAPAVILRPPPAPVSRTVHGVADTPFWILTGTGAGLLVGGAALGGLALQRRGEARDFVVGRDGTAKEQSNLQRSAEERALAADILLASGGTALVTAALLYALRTRTVRTSRRHTQAGIGWVDRAPVLWIRGEL